MTNPSIISYIDLTRLNESDLTDKYIRELCEQAKTPKGNVAAVCVHPHFLKVVNDVLPKKKIKRATVVNFPSGNQSFEEIEHDIRYASDAGCDEIDFVFPYQTYLSGNAKEAIEVTQKAKQLSQEKSFKVIMETGAFTDSKTLYNACCDAINAGADFLKTSTGKIEQGASPEAVEVFIQAIKDTNTMGKVGIKVSGGVREIAEAESYLAQVTHGLGDAYASPALFRIGASSLLEKLLES